MQEGLVAVHLLIDETGKIDGMKVVQSSTPGVFERAAVEALAKVRFAPGRIAGVAVKSQVTIELHFQPIDRGAAVSERGY